MKKSLLVIMVCLAFMAFIFGCKSETPKQAEAPKPAAPAATPAPAPAQPAVAGGTVLGVSVTELVAVVNGWSIKKQILGKDVYNTTKAKRSVRLMTLSSVRTKRSPTLSSGPAASWELTDTT